MVFFNEEEHKYTNTNNEVYTSSTQFVSLFKQKFDSEFWSFYKAFEAELPEIFKKSKRRIFQLGKTIESIQSLVPKSELHKVLVRQKVILLEWNTSKEVACKEGTIYHNKREEITHKVSFITDNFEGKDIKYPFLCKKTIAELVVYNHEFFLAGMIDRVMFGVDGSFKMSDYKTSKVINYENKYAKMLGPVSELDDCNLNHYTLQLSLYAWMLEQLGYTCNSLTIIHVPYIDPEDPSRGRKSIPIQVPYVKEKIEKMLDWFVKNK